MDFLLKFNTSDLNVLNWDTVINNGPTLQSNKINLIQNDTKFYREINFTNGKAILIGDPIINETNSKSVVNYLEKKDVSSFIKAVDGFYFLMVLNSTDKKITVTSSMFSLLSVYYLQTGKEISISSSLSILKKENANISYSVDQQYYIEKALFNYPLFNRTPFKEIKLLSSNSILKISSEEIQIEKHTEIHNYFTDTPTPWRNSVESISDLFIDCAKPFLPSEKFITTLTGGFDGRVVAGLALSERKPFETYSYGSAEDPDVILAKDISNKINVKYHPLLLGADFATHHYWHHAQAFVTESNGLGNFSRAHYGFATDTVLKNTNYLLTGNFGSELIRAMKTPGVMISELGFDLFRTDFKERVQEKIKSCKALNYLHPDLISVTLNNLEAELINYLNSLPGHLSQNQKFYIFIFEEVFRKYFGPEISIQRKKLNNRSPFLCFRFIQELLKTEIAGANSKFQESNPINRYHGQVLYAHILKKTYPQLNEMNLDRGYKPKDFLTTFGIAKIVLGQVKRKYITKRNTVIPSYANSILDSNVNNFKSIKLESDIFNTPYFETMNKGSWRTDQRNYLNMNSAAYYLSSLTH